MNNDKLSIFLLGDFILDQYYFGTVKKFSQEAPIPILSNVTKKTFPGGAANVAHLLSQLNNVKINFCFKAGPDTKCKLIEFNNNVNLVPILDDRYTIATKHRYITNNQLLY